MITVDGPMFSRDYIQALNLLESDVIIATVQDLEYELTEKENYYLDAMRLDSGVASKKLELIVKSNIRASAQVVRDKLKEMQASNCHARELKTEFNKLIHEFETSSHLSIVVTRLKFLEAQRQVKERNETLADKVEKTTLNSAPFVPRK